MARNHYWQYLLNEEGQPIEDADITVTLAGTSTAAYVFEAESGGVATITPGITTSSTGYFEFWIGDSRETNGYAKTQKFKIQWAKTGISTQNIDNVDVFPNIPSFTSNYSSSTSWTVVHELNSSALVVTAWVDDRVKTHLATIARVDDDNLTVTWNAPSAGSVNIVAC